MERKTQEQLKLAAGGLQSILGNFKSAAAYKAAGQAQYQGAIFAEQAAREQIPTVKSAALFNTQIDYENTSRQLQSLTSQYSRVSGSQTVNWSTGLGSKSLQLIRNETLDNFTRQVQNIRLDFQNRKSARDYETSVRAAQLENQARASRYTGEVALSLSRAKAAAERTQAYSTAGRTLISLGADSGTDN